MANKKHHYAAELHWIGNLGEGTKSYASYSRNHEFKVVGKPVLPGSSDPSFKGDPTRYNPEELLLSAISNCHMLWYLHLCSVNGIVVTAYEDHAVATMEENQDGSGKFTEAILRPVITITKGDAAKATDLHHEAHKFCFIAQSVNFEIKCDSKLIQA